MSNTNDNLPAIRPTSTGIISPFSTAEAFTTAQRMCAALTSSNLVPVEYQGEENLGNALIALEMSQRVGASIMAVMQNLHIIEGKPTWSSSFIIASLNSCGRFSPIRFTLTRGAAKSITMTRTWRDKRTGERRSREEVIDMSSTDTCFAWATDLASGEKLEGPVVSIEMAAREGWYSRPGSKWLTMPDLMLRYRAAAFFGRLYAPDVLNGMHSDDEIVDMRTVESDPVVDAAMSPKSASLASAIAEAKPVDQLTVPTQPVTATVEPAKSVTRSRRAAKEPEPIVEAEMELEQDNSAPTPDDGDCF